MIYGKCNVLECCTSLMFVVINVVLCRSEIRVIIKCLSTCGKLMFNIIGNVYKVVLAMCSGNVLRQCSYKHNKVHGPRCRRDEGCKVA